jgi:hypothetical protein
MRPHPGGPCPETQEAITTEPDPQFVSSIPPHQKAGYDAVYEVIRANPGDAWRNAVIWKAVEAYRTASEGGHEREVRDQIVTAIKELIERGYPQAVTAGLQAAQDVVRGEAG